MREVESEVDKETRFGGKGNGGRDIKGRRPRERPRKWWGDAF